MPPAAAHTMPALAAAPFCAFRSISWLPAAKSENNAAVSGVAAATAADQGRGRRIGGAIVLRSACARDKISDISADHISWRVAAAIAAFPATTCGWHAARAWCRPPVTHARIFMLPRCLPCRPLLPCLLTLPLPPPAAGSTLRAVGVCAPLLLRCCAFALLRAACASRCCG